MHEARRHSIKRQRLARAAAWILVAGVAAALLTPTTASAQRMAADTSIAALVEHVRTNTGNPARTIAVMNQSRGPESPEKLDALADSLVAIVLTARSDAPETYSHARAAVRVLREARGYPGAFDALVRIYEETDDVGFQGGALAEMARRADRSDQAIAFLREAATSDEFVAFAAIEILAGHRVPDADLGPEGRAVLRQLHEQELVTQPQARRQLQFIARERGWPPR